MHRHPHPLLSVALLAGCTVGSPPPHDPGFPDAGSPGRAALVLEPSEVTLHSLDGSTPAVTFRAWLEGPGDQRREVWPLEWVTSHDRLGAMDGDGTFTASGRAGGTLLVAGTLWTEGAPLVAQATVTVNVERNATDGPGVPASVIADFARLPEREDPFVAPSLLYPLAGARMPNNVSPPDLQWSPVGREGDAFRVTLRAAHATVRSYLVHSGASFGSHHVPDAADFRVIADSARSAEVTLQVDRLPASRDRVIPGLPTTIWLSEDGLFGTIYYWQVRERPESSDVYRVDAATGQRRTVFDRPTGCVGCHALSQDGRQLAATIGGFAWSTEIVDATSDASPAPQLLGPFEPAFNTLAWDLLGQRILASRPVSHDRSDSRLFLLDAADGRPVPATGLPAGPAGYPTWSPDGARVAWTEGGGDGPDGTAARTQLVIADVAGDVFTARLLHDGGELATAPEGGLTDSRPTFSPDSRWLAFAHGSRSISTITSAGVRPRSSLYLVAAAGGAPLRLERGMGPEGPVDAFWPVFSPFATQEADGTIHHWLAFYSRQGYGNEVAGTRGTGRRQLWVMAIDPARAAAGLDPSHPPYWLPGQDTAADDIAALWAPTACRGRGERCGASTECCSGLCAAADPAHPEQLTCQAPATCRRPGEPCGTADDCCAGLECNLHTCDYQPPE